MPLACSFIDLFAANLASKLIPCNDFKSNLTTSFDASSEQGDKNIKMYWRTPLLSNDVSFYYREETNIGQRNEEPNTNENSEHERENENENGRVFFVDVTFIFVGSGGHDQARHAGPTDNKMPNSNSPDVTMPHVDVKLGALIQLPRNTARPTSSSAGESGHLSGEAFYIQSDPITHESLESYANQIGVDFDGTGYVGMSDIMSESLLSSSQIHFSSKEKRNGGIEEENTKNELSWTVDVGLCHEAFGEGKMNICKDKYISELMHGSMGTMSLQMLLTNIGISDANFDRKVKKCEENKGGLENRIGNDSDKERAMEIFHQWWERQEDLIVDQQKEVQNLKVGIKDSNILSSQSMKKISQPSSIAASEQKPSMQITMNRKRVHGHTMININRRSKRKKKGPLTIGKMT